MTPTTPSRMTGTVTMYTTPWCGYCHRLKSQLDREGIAYDVVDIEQHPEAAEIVEQVNHGNQTVPTLVYADGSAQTNPSVAQVKDEAGRADALAPEPGSPASPGSGPPYQCSTSERRSRRRRAARACRPRPRPSSARG